MKNLMRSFAIGLGGILWLSALNAKADVSVFASVHISAEADFHAPLAAHGAWVEVDSFGRCWRPGGVVVGWQPYCHGHWVWTDCGWYWVSDEPWAWACYHYGHWFRHHRHGWIWRPGIEWAPAWVSWRVGGGYVGWAPLPPRVGLFARAPEPTFFFVQAGRFHEPVRPSTVIVNNTTIIKQTKVINNIKQETRTFGDSGPRKVMINEGPGRVEIDKATGNKVRAVSIQEAVRRTPAPASVEHRAIESKGKEKSRASARDADGSPTTIERKPERADKSGVSPKQSPPDRGTPDHPKLAPERKPGPDNPPRQAPPGRGKDPSRDNVDPSPGKRSTPDAPADDPSKSGKGGKGKGRKGGGPHGG